MKKIKKNINLFFKALSFGALLISLNSCSSDDSIINELGEVDDPDFETTDWTIETHSNFVSPNFDEVFGDNAVKRLDIVITEARWQSMLDDMTAIYGAFGVSSSPSGGDIDPISIPAEIFYNGLEWYRVGVSFKENSGLQQSWQSGILKLPFNLDFDEFEDAYPQIENQRFYGFKKLSLKNNFSDKLILKDKTATSELSDEVIETSNKAFYTVYVDHGEGPQYFGVYTMVEEVDQTS
ncbi:CotH protein [Gillisia sp. Hel_I_86]|uniref:CotH kinase family protein n=1 Tax=Gillisia sp. Hel_I_86 TaxID=1249981 RepID=UPI00119AB0ED|nr:CotH kinase family protein [Gillisia sp. Hel_I_86]TVZ27947.1 CotH protein [Gillisia sp. Hel_I_86]